MFEKLVKKSIYKGYEFYTNSDKELPEEKKDFIVKRINDLKTDIKDIFEIIKIDLKAKNINPNYILYTGQSLSSYLLSNNKFFNVANINDIDIFIMDYRNRIRNTEKENIFESTVISVYDNFSSASYGYSITHTEKDLFHFKQKDIPSGNEIWYSNYINYVFYQDFYTEFRFSNLDPFKRYLLSYLSTLNYFDLNNVQIGLMINPETLDIKILYTENYYNFLVNKQIEYNRKRVSKRSIERLYEKYKFICPSAIRNFSIKDKSKMYFYDKNYHLQFCYLFNRVSQSIYERFKDSVEGINYNHVGIFQKWIEIGKQIEFLESDGKFNYYFPSVNSVNARKIKYFLKDPKILNALLYTAFKANTSIKSLQFDYFELKTDNEELFKRIDFVIDLMKDEEQDFFSFIYNSVSDFTNLNLLFNTIIYLSRLSQKKLLIIKNYFKKKNKLSLLKLLLIYFSIEPRLLNLNLNDLELLGELANGHSLLLFEIPFKFSLNPLETAKYFIKLFKIFQKRKKEIDFDIDLNQFIGYLENLDSKIHTMMMQSSDVNEIIDRYFEHLKKEKEKLTKKFHDLKKIKIEKNGFVCEELLTSLELKKEGAFMKHCVGGYGDRCSNFNAVIFRLYHKNKNPLESHESNEFRYTAEIDPSTFNVVQIRGKRNKSIEKDHKEIVNELIKETIEQLKERKEFYQEQLKNLNRLRPTIIEEPFFDFP